MVDARQSFHHRQRAATLIDLKKFDAAAREARRALEQNPDSEAHRLLAWALWQQGKLGEAEHAARKALGLAPNNAECHSTLALVLSHQGRHEEAETHYQKAVALAPRIHVFHCRYAGFCLRTGQWEAALKKADEALRLAPGHVESLTVRADALCRLDRLEEAEETAHQALALNPNWPGAHHVLGHIYQARRQIDKALGSFRESLRLAPMNQPYKQCLARAVGAKFPILGLLWRGTLEGRRRFAQAYFWIGSALLALLSYAILKQFAPELVCLSATSFVAFPWMLVILLRLVDRTLTAAVMRGWIK